MVKSGRPRTILFATTEWVTAEAFLFDQLEYLAENDWKVHLTCANIPETIGPRGPVEKTRLHPMSVQRAPSIGNDLRSLFEFLAVIRAVDPDVFVGSTPKASFLGLFAARVLGVRFRVYWIHGLRYETQTGLFRWVLRQFERLSVFLATHILTVSDSLNAKLRIEIPASIPKTGGARHSHANGVASERFRPPSPRRRQAVRESFQLSPDALAVGYMGRLTPDKGILLLVEAMEEVVERFPDAILLVAGEPDEAKSFSREELQDFKLEYVRMVGFQPDPIAFYHSLDLFCMPSLREGLSTVNLEAASCGLAVVTTTATGCIDSVVPDSTGIVVPPADSRELSHAIIALLGDKNRCRAMGTLGRQWVAKNFAQEDVWNRNLDYFNSLEYRA